MCLSAVTLVGLDTRLGCLQPNLSPDSDGMKMIDSVRNMMDCVANLEKFSGRPQVWKIFPTPTWKKFVKGNDVFTE